MKIERGIISFNNQNEMIVCLPGHIYKLNNNSFYRKTLSDDQNVLGVIVNNKFSICREFISTTGHFIFGYINKDMESAQEICVQSIKGFNRSNFNPFDAEYAIGNEAMVEIN